ncbi:ribokinase [Clostridium acetireducens DSM 10703]|jgi:ribokinase|uniref:Ribokinase n=1 Tax=Clostridium acetireducens DSM 10703 TaxID=1121290 RepID=A0A1E8EWY3_9CLOT|nr:ribokinase [Clostridium acetireducens]OFI01508.1 ribokinase [Clostridium acetireducens DSM 10703]
MSNVCVLGSINMDIVLRVDRMVKSGETILSKGFNKNPGGKGANQAVAARRLGAEVFIIGKVSNDDNGDVLLKCLKKDGIKIDYVFEDKENPTGMAIISVDNEGNNSIVVVPGANMNISLQEIEKCRKVIENSNIIVSQFETPVEATIHAFKIAREKGVITILNPAPAKEIPDDLLNITDIIIPNETEAFEITKVNVHTKETAKEAADKLIHKGVKYVIITLGEKGAVLVSKDNMSVIPAYKVKAVDTTAAGDSFIGALASKLEKENKIDFYTLESAVKFGNKVSSITVQRQGAQVSIPTLKEVL